MAALVIRLADRADLPDLLDLYRYLDPGDARCPPEAADAILDCLSRYAGSAVLSIIRRSGRRFGDKNDAKTRS